MKNIAILASGNGTNAENIARLFNGGNRIRVALVLVNRRKAGVIERMKPLGVPVEYIPNSVWDTEPMKVVDILRAHHIDLVVLAGFMHYVNPVILDAFPSAVVNIHPSLLPAYGGQGMWGHHVHQAVIAAGEKESGVTVHLVTPEFDKGEIVMQQRIPVEPDDTPETLEAKIHKIEYELYPKAIVAALDNLESRRRSRPVPPPVPKSADEDWAEVLKMKYDPELTKTPPPVPGDAPAVPPVHPAPAPVRQVVAQEPLPQGENAPMPPTYFVWALLTTICCCLIPGIVAIVYSTSVSARYSAGDIEGARRASRNAAIWIIVSFVLGVISLPFVLLTSLS